MDTSHSTASHYVALDHLLEYIVLQHITFQYFTLHYITLRPLRIGEYVCVNNMGGNGRYFVASAIILDGHMYTYMYANKHE